MTRTKQTARKEHRRKTVSNGKRKRKRQPEGRTLLQERSVDRKVVLEYSSDETPDENAPQPAEGAGGTKTGKETDTPDSADQPSPCDHD